MEFIELVKKRYSVRAYEARSVEREKLDYVLECARLAPSAVNRQPWHFVVAESAEARERLCACYHNEWLRQAPVIVAVCVDSGAAWTRQNDGKNHADVDGSMRQSIYASQLPRWDLALAGCATSTMRQQLLHSVCPKGSIPWHWCRWDMQPTQRVSVTHRASPQNRW